MKAVLIEEFGGPDVLRVGDAQPPSPAADQVLIRVMATSVNRPDIIQRLGHYPPPPGESEILGLEVAGVVEKTGAGVSAWKAGDRVMTLVAGGGYAEFAVAYSAHLIPIPDSMSYEEAACVCETYITAYLNLFMLGDVSGARAALLHGGGGGVNTAAIQLCRALTPRTKLIVTASHSKVERVTELGADLAVDYKAEDFSEAALAYTGDVGVDIILDHIGGPYLQSNLRALAIGGRLVIIGIMGGPKADINLAQLMVKRQRIIGSVLRPRPVEEKGNITSTFAAAVLPLLSDRAIVPLIHSVYDLERVQDAHRMMESSGHFGKIVLKVNR